MFQAFVKSAMCAFGGICLLFGDASGRAAPITYSDFASWSAAVNNITNVVIPEPVSAFPRYDTIGVGTASVTYDNVLFSTSSTYSSDGRFLLIADNYNDGTQWNNAPLLSSQGQSSGLANILITFPTPVTGVAINYNAYNGSPVTFTLSNGDIITQPSTTHGYTLGNFFGATDSPFTSVLVTSPDAALNLDPHYSTAAPEPATLTLLGLGTAGLAAYGWRRRKRLPCRPTS